MKENAVWALCLIVPAVFAAPQNIWAQGRKPYGNNAAGSTVVTSSAPIRPAPVMSAPITEKFTSPFQARKIALDEAKSMYDSGKAVFIDGRSSVSYNTRHIKGALNCSMGDYELNVAELKRKLPLDTYLIVYCSSENCGLAESVAERLAQSGFSNIAVYSGGWAAWAGANYPSEP